MNSYVKPRLVTSHFFVIAVITAIVAVTNSAAHKSSRSADSDVVNVEVFYESLCYDSVQFIKNQLVPVERQLGDHLRVTYVPYGKATHAKVTDKDGVEKWQFTCQHGPAECYGNKAQACGIDEILKNPGIINKQQSLANFVGCVMSAGNPSTAVPRCFESISVDETSRSSVDACISSTKGDELLALYGDRTHSLLPNLAFVPTIVFDGVFSQVEQTSAHNDFRAAVCRHIPAHVKPSICLT